MIYQYTKRVYLYLADCKYTKGVYLHIADWKQIKLYKICIEYRAVCNSTKYRVQRSKESLDGLN